MSRLAHLPSLNRIQSGLSVNRTIVCTMKFPPGDDPEEKNPAGIGTLRLSRRVPGKAASERVLGRVPIAP